MNGVYSAKEAEAMALRESLQWLRHHNYNHCILELDVVQVFKLCASVEIAHLLVC